ncbi:hypothetical protein [Nonomuraea sp. NPDC002799]
MLASTIVRMPAARVGRAAPATPRPAPTYDATGGLTKHTDALGNATTFGYDAAGAQTRVTNGRGHSTYITNNSLGLTETVIEPSTAQHQDLKDRTWTAGYDASGNPTVTLAPGGVRVERTFDELNRLVQRTDGAGTSTFTWDDGDRLSQSTDPVSGKAIDYSYDRANRLTSWTAPDGNKTDYGWDAAGNRVKAGDKTYTYDERDRLTSGDGHTYTYTARGTLKEDSAGIVRIAKFDAFDRLITDDAVTYGYDALDRMETRTQSGQTSRFTYDGTSNNLVTVTGANGATTATVGRDALGRTLGISEGVGAQLAFSGLRGDLIGTFTADGTALADSVAYDPCGEVITRSGAQHSLGYQGGYTDSASGVIDYVECRSSSKDCSVVDDWYMKSAQKSGETGCVGDTGYSGSNGPRAKDVYEALAWKYEYYLNNLLKTVLENTTWGTGACAMFIAVTHLIGLACGMVSVFSGALSIAIGAAYKGHGIVVTYRVTNGHQSATIGTQQPGRG